MPRSFSSVFAVIQTALVLTACATAGQQDDSDADSGSEISPFRDTGRFADTGGSDCSGADCPCLPSPEICNSRDEDCDGRVDEDFNFMSDLDNCGACALACVPANARGLCVEGVCGIDSCFAGFGDCDGEPSNGCETEIASSTGCADCALLGGVNGEPCGPCEAGVWACQTDGSTVCDIDGTGEALNPCGGCGALEGVPGERCGECDSGAWACETQTSVNCVGDLGDLAYNSCGECTTFDNCSPGETQERPSACPGGEAETRVCSDVCRWSDWTCDAPATICTPHAIETEDRGCGDCAEGTQSRTRACAADGTSWLPWSAWGACRTSAACAPGETDSQTQSCGVCPGGSQTRTRGCDAATCSWGDWSPYGACEGESGSCSPGDTDSQTRSCSCGGDESRTRTCNDSCDWGGWSGWSGCSGGECTPGDTRAGSCDGCSEQVCNDSCRWSGCQLRTGNACDWERGTNWRCCATNGWQFCLSSCQWSTDCAPCTGCGCR